MKTFVEKQDELFAQIEERLRKLILWKGVTSDYVSASNPCLKLEAKYPYKEIINQDNRITFLDECGNFYSLRCVDFEILCEITDNLGIFNPYAPDVNKYPVRVLTDPTIDINKYSNFHASGNIEGMKQKYYGKGALLVRHGNFIYNVTEDPEIYFESSK